MSENQENEIKKLIKGQGYTMEEAAALLNMARQSLYNNIRKNPLDVDFVKNVKENIKIDLDKMSSVTTGGNEKSALRKIEKLERENEELRKELNELKNKLIQILLNQKNKS
jgi:transcriptional regulator with XRE-family HTH domain